MVLELQGIALEAERNQGDDRPDSYALAFEASRSVAYKIPDAKVFSIQVNVGDLRPAMSGLSTPFSYTVLDDPVESTSGTDDYSYRVAEAQLQGIEVELAIEPKLSGVEIGIGREPELKGIEIEVSRVIELQGIELGIALSEDLAHPEWIGSEGIKDSIVNDDYTVNIEANSDATDNTAKAFYEVFLALNHITAEVLFADSNFIGAFSFHTCRLSKLRDGTFIQPDTDYTVGIRLVDLYRNKEDQNIINQFHTPVLVVTWLDPPKLQLTDDLTGDSCTVLLTSIPSNPDYDRVEVYRLQGPTSNPGYSIDICTFINVGESFQITGLEVAEEVKLIAVAKDTSENAGYPSQIYSIIISDGKALPVFEEGTVPSQYPTIVGETHGQGVKYPIEIAVAGEGGEPLHSGMEMSRGKARIEESILFILKTMLHSRIMRGGWGSLLFAIPFEPLNEFLDQVLPSMVKETIEINEPRAIITGVKAYAFDRRQGIVKISIDWAATNSSETGNAIFPYDWNEGSQ